MSRARDLGDIIEGGQDVKFTGGDITTNNTTASVFNTTVTTLNIGQAATTISIGAISGTTDVRNNLSVAGTLNIIGNTTLTGDIAVNGGDITTSATTATIFNAAATTINIGQAATTISVGATTGTTTIRNNVSVAGTLGVIGNTTLTGDIAVNGGDITTSATTASVFDTAATTVNIARAGTAVVIGATTGTTNIRNAIQLNGTTIVSTARQLQNISGLDQNTTNIIKQAVGSVSNNASIAYSLIAG